ncbi:MAG: hypothetical protein NTV68_02785 [Methanomicrobiales archaeon]|nr:hypothetical protein [Methanomicrobiales archaeon]
MKPNNKEKSRDKTKKASTWTGTKIALVVVGVLFVVLMIASTIPMSVFSSLKGTQPGDMATVAYTIYDDQNRPIVTSNVKLYNDTLAKGGTVFYSNPLQVPVNVTTMKNVTRIPVQYQQYQNYFGLFRDEMNLIATGLSGMKVNEQKRLSLVMPKDPLETQISADQFALLVKPVNETRVNEQFALALTDHPQINLDNTTPVDQYLRTFYVKGISPDGLDMKYGYSTIDLQIISLKTQ